MINQPQINQPGIVRYLELGLWLGLAALAYGLSFRFADEPGSYRWGPANWPRAIALLMLVGRWSTSRPRGGRAESGPARTKSGSDAGWRPPGSS